MYVHTSFITYTYIHIQLHAHEQHQHTHTHTNSHTLQCHYFCVLEEFFLQTRIGGVPLLPSQFATASSSRCAWAPQESFCSRVSSNGYGCDSVQDFDTTHCCCDSANGGALLLPFGFLAARTLVRKRSVMAISDSRRIEFRMYTSSRCIDRSWHFNTRRARCSRRRLSPSSFAAALADADILRVASTRRPARRDAISALSRVSVPDRVFIVSAPVVNEEVDDDICGVGTVPSSIALREDGAAAAV